MYKTLKFVVMGLEPCGNSNSKTCNSRVAKKYTGDKKTSKKISADYGFMSPDTEIETIKK